MLTFLKNLFTRRQQKATANINFPLGWEQMTLPQFMDVCYILTLQGLSRERGLFLMLCKLSGLIPVSVKDVDGDIIKKNKGKDPYWIDNKIHMISRTTITDAANLLSYIYDNVGLPPSPFKNVERKLFGISFDTFYTVDSLVIRAQVENNFGYLKAAAKTLTGGRVRKLDPVLQRAFIIWWAGVKEYLQQLYPYVLTKGEGGITDKTQAEILQDLLSVMNDNKPQDNERILKTDMHSVLHALNKIYCDAHKRNSK